MADEPSLLGGQLSLGKHISGLLASGGVHVEVLEEDLGAAGGRSAALAVVGTLDVDGRGHGSVRVSEGSSLAVGAGDTVALGIGGLDDEFQVGHIAGDGSQLEGHRRCGEGDGRGIRSDDTGEVGHGGHDVAAAINHPVVQPHKEVGTGNLGLGTQHGLALCGVGRCIPGKDLLVGETLPGLRELLENSFYGRLERGSGRTTVSTVADVLSAASLGGGDTLCGARHFVEGD
jgi:hypothetical protein